MANELNIFCYVASGAKIVLKSTISSSQLFLLKQKLGRVGGGWGERERKLQGFTATISFF